MAEARGSSVGAFQHEPLDIARQTIRAVQIQPGDAECTIKCTLQHVPLAKNHVCLSYTWRDGPAFRTILINEQSFLICQSLCDFLWRARKKHVSCLLWIDAICVDQANVKERNHQVGLMEDIYRRPNTPMPGLVEALRRSKLQLPKSRAIPNMETTSF